MVASDARFHPGESITPSSQFRRWRFSWQRPRRGTGGRSVMSRTWSRGWQDSIGDLVQMPYCYCIHDADADDKESIAKTTCTLSSAGLARQPTRWPSLSFSSSAKAVNTCKPVLNMRHAYDYLIHDTESCRKARKHLYGPEELRVWQQLRHWHVRAGVRRGKARRCSRSSWASSSSRASRPSMTPRLRLRGNFRIPTGRWLSDTTAFLRAILPGQLSQEKGGRRVNGEIGDHGGETGPRRVGLSPRSPISGDWRGGQIGMMLD